MYILWVTVSLNESWRFIRARQLVLTVHVREFSAFRGVDVGLCCDCSVPMAPLVSKLHFLSIV